MLRFAKWALIGITTILLMVGIGLGVAWIATAPDPLPRGTETASRLAPGPHAVGREEYHWIDQSRPTPQNGEYLGAAQREFPVTLWFPRNLGGRYPLLIFSHGLVSSRYGVTYMAEHLASHGHIVLAADHPLSNFDAPGGPTHVDVVNQPADVSFMIDQVLALEPSVRPFRGEIDRERIGVFGISLGGATATLVAFHPERRDRRIAAAISIGGPGDVFGLRFFDHASVHFLMIAGTSDAIVDYKINAAPIPVRFRQGGLLTIEGGTHAGFTHVTAGILRVLGNPDNIGCRAATPDVVPQEESVFVGLFGTREQGLLTPATYRPPCGKTYDNAMRAGRQHMITKLAVRAFFGSQFAKTEQARKAHERFLTRTLPAEVPEVSYTPSGRLRQ